MLLSREIDCPVECRMSLKVTLCSACADILKGGIHQYFAVAGGFEKTLYDIGFVREPHENILAPSTRIIAFIHEPVPCVRAVRALVAEKLILGHIRRVTERGCRHPVVPYKWRRCREKRVAAVPSLRPRIVDELERRGLEIVGRWGIRRRRARRRRISRARRGVAPVLPAVACSENQ